LYARFDREFEDPDISNLVEPAARLVNLKLKAKEGAFVEAPTKNEADMIPLKKCRRDRACWWEDLILEEALFCLFSERVTAAVTQHILKIQRGFQHRDRMAF
jgi:hypothetical protein